MGGEAAAAGSEIQEADQWHASLFNGHQFSCSSTAASLLGLNQAYVESATRSEFSAALGGGVEDLVLVRALVSLYDRMGCGGRVRKSDVTCRS